MTRTHTSGTGKRRSNRDDFQSAPDRARAGKTPRQGRSRKTHDLLLDAAERLLRDRPWEEISIVEIMREANCSNGAIYGRFKGKDELLVALYERHDEKLKARFERQQKVARSRKDEALEQFLEREIDQLIKTMRQNRWLLRAMGLLSRTRPDVVSAAVRDERRAMFDRVGERIMKFDDQIDHPDPRRGAQRAVFFVATIVREAVLYQGPHAGTLKLGDRELKSSLMQMALGFLGASGAIRSNDKSAKTKNRKSRKRKSG